MRLVRELKSEFASFLNRQIWSLWGGPLATLDAETEEVLEHLRGAETT